jgi:2,4'-dihydroxyacetophenone dioxygenase
MADSPHPGLKIVKTGLAGLTTPPDMLAEIMSPDSFSTEDERFWAPLGNECFSKPLILSVSEGYYVHLLLVKRPGIVNRHRHSQQVQLLTLKGHWHYPEKDWVAGPGTYVFEPPGDVHTLVVPEGGAPMMFVAFVRGALLYVDEQGNLTGYDDVFTRLEAVRKHHRASGLGDEHLQRVIR